MFVAIVRTKICLYSACIRKAYLLCGMLGENSC